jgi:integrase
MLDPPIREVPASQAGQRRRRGYNLAPPGTPQTRQRDALIVSLMAYAGLRPGELRALRFGAVREYMLVAGRPAGKALILLDDEGETWDKNVWQMWRADRWAPACRAAGFDPVPRPYDLRHSFTSLLLAEGRQPLYVARQLGHSVSVLLSTYAHLIDEYEERDRIDADAEIAGARRKVGTHLVRTEAIGGPSTAR